MVGRWMVVQTVRHKCRQQRWRWYLEDWRWLQRRASQSHAGQTQLDKPADDRVFSLNIADACIMCICLSVARFLNIKHAKASRKTIYFDALKVSQVTHYKRTMLYRHLLQFFFLFNIVTVKWFLNDLYFVLPQFTRLTDRRRTYVQTDRYLSRR